MELLILEVVREEEEGIEITFPPAEWYSKGLFGTRQSDVGLTSSSVRRSSVFLRIETMSSCTEKGFSI